MRWVVAAGLVVGMGMAVTAQAEAPATVRAVRRITAPNMTRLIVEFSAPVHYRMQRAAGRPDLGIPPRLYVDFPGTQLSEAARAGFELDEGPLLRLRSTQSTATTARLILDVPGLSDFGAFAMPDPFRLIIDVRGTERVASHPADIPERGLEPAARATAAVGTPRATVPSDTAVAARPRLATPVPSARASRPTSERQQRAPGQIAARRFKILLDPGHGGKDPGAVGVEGVAEKDVVLVIALRLRDRIAAAGDIDVVLTRDTDIFLALEERTARANAERADLFVSIHANASANPRLSGVETYYLNNTNDRATIRLAEMENGLRSMTGRGAGDRGASLILSDLIQSYKIQESVALAEDLQHALVTALDTRSTRVNNLGVKRGPFYVLVGAGMPCALVEVAFLTNQQEGARLAQPTYQDTIAEGLLRGIRRFVENARVAENL